MSKDEEWKDIPGYSLYEASSFGKVRRKEDMKILNPFLDGDNYPQFNLVSDGIKTNYPHLHQLVCLAFHGEPDPSIKNPRVDHLDMDRLNNIPSNLEWVSHAENLKRARARGGESHFRRYKIYCKELNEYYSSCSEASKKLGIRLESIREHSKDGKPYKGYTLTRLYSD